MPHFGAVSTGIQTKVNEYERGLESTKTKVKYPGVRTGI